MSTPANRLSSYRSYSYYQVLTVCDSTETAFALSQGTDASIWQHADDSALPFGKFTPKSISGTKGKYVVLIHGAQDASFVITNMSWTSATAAAATQNDMNTSIAIEGRMSISEPKGVIFLDQLVRSCGALNIDASTAVFVLKTFFTGTGYEPGVGDFFDELSDIPPVQFVMLDVTGVFSEMGGSYELSFVSLVNGVTRLPQYSKSATSITLTAGANLASTLKALETSINSGYATYFDCVRSQVEISAKQLNQDPVPILDSLRPVKYTIDMGTYFTDNADLYMVTDTPNQTKDVPGTDKPSKINLSAQTSVEDAIHNIMSMSPQVKKDMAEGDTVSGKKYEYKIHTALKSYPVGDDNSRFNYEVIYRVERFLRPKSISMSFNATDVESVNMIKRNLISFDYIYTGKNIDILEFDMKVNMGMAYLQIATLANTYKSSLEMAPVKQIIPSAMGQTQLVRGQALTQVPVYFGSQVNLPRFNNTNNTAAAAQSAYTLSQHASLEVQSATMKIIGNPALLGTISAATSPEALALRSNASTQTDLVNAQADFMDWGFVPSYVKVKIKMPRNNDDLSLFSGQVNPTDSVTGAGVADYAQDFWFDGYYYVVGIEHSFEEGEFTQTLQLIGLPQEGVFNNLNKSDKKEMSFTANLANCYECNPTLGQKGGAASSTTAPAAGQPTVVNGVVQPGGVSPTTATDSNILSQKAAAGGNLSNIIGWDSADNTVKSGILNAASKNGIDPFMLAQIAAHESKFKATAFNTASNAAGLYQFLGSTWKGIWPSQPAIGNDLASRFDPSLNADAGSRYLLTSVKSGATSAGDIYLMHFLGQPLGKQVIKLDNSGKGNTPLVDVYRSTYRTQAEGDSRYNASKNANGQIFVQNDSATLIRSWAATVMAKTLKNGTSPVAGNPTTSQAANNAVVAPTGPRPSAVANTTQTRTARDALFATQNNVMVQKAIAAGKVPVGSIKADTITASSTPVNTPTYTI